MSHTFRLRLRPYLRDGLWFARFLCVLLGVVFVIQAWPEWDKMLGLAGILGVAAVAIVGLTVGVGAVVRWVRVVRVDAEGVTGTTFFGRRARVRWSEIESVDFDDGSPSYLALSIRGWRRRLYVPADLERGRAFDALIVQYAGRDHPLADYRLPTEDDAAPADDR